MPRIGEQRGVTFYIYFGDHGPPHFQARSESGNFDYLIETLLPMRGQQPPKALHQVVQSWGLSNKSYLEIKWDEIAGKPPHSQNLSQPLVRGHKSKRRGKRK